MLKLADSSRTPPGGWHAPGNCGITAYSSDAPMYHRGTFNDLILAITEYRVANLLPFEDVRREVEEWICRETKARCRVVAPETTSDAREITVADVWRFLKAMGAWTKNLTMVDQEEADRRSEICAGCTRQADTVGCWGCSQLAELIFSVIGDRRTRFKTQLRSCSVCGCNNSAQAWVPIEVLKKASGDLEYPEQVNGPGSPQCWKR